MVRRSGVTRIVPTPTVSTVQGVVQSLPPVNMARLPAPRYTADPKYIDTKVALAVEDMRHHMSDEGYQIFYGLGLNGYELCGHNLTVNETSVPRILDITKPKVLVIQDKREWDVAPGNFRVTLLKDAHQRPKYHAESADEMGIHAWITYYNTHIVKRLAPYVRPQHILRTYHTIDANLIPKYTADDRDNCLLSGAVSTAYP
jgi:hypothetical protein